MRFLRSPGFLAAAGAVAMGLALQRSSGMYDPLSLALATLTSACAVAAALLARRAQQPRAELLAMLILGAGIAHGLWCHIFEVPTFYADPSRMQGFRYLAFFTLLITSAYLCVHLRASLNKARFLAALLIFAAMGAAILHLSPEPRIDVFLFRSIGGDALAHGFNPYSISYPDLYAATGETLKMYGPELVKDGRVLVYPYPPLTPLLDAAAYTLLHDVRWLNLAAFIVAAWAIGRIGQSQPLAELAALFLLFQGRSFFVLEQAWTEPIVLAAFTVSLLLALQPEPRWLALGLALGVLAASKQYSPLLILPILAAYPREQRARAALTALALLAAVTLPFVLWDAQGFVTDVIRMQFVQPLRLDSLSLLTALARVRELPPAATLLGFVAAAAVLALTLRRNLTALQAATAAGASWLVLVLLSKQAFCNYDFLGQGLLCTAVAASARKEGPAT